MSLHDSNKPPSEDNKKTADYVDAASSPSVPTGRSAWFGGKDVAIGPRISPVLSSISLVGSDSDESSTAILDKQIALEDGCAIQYRTCSWQKVPFPLPCLCATIQDFSCA